MSDEQPPDDSRDRDREGDDTRAANERERTRERTTDAVDREARADDQAGASTSTVRNGGASDPEAEPSSDGGDTGSGSGGRSDRIAFVVSAIVGLVLAVGSIALVSGRGPFFEDLLRVRPSVEGGGVGADWVVGNTEPALEIAIAVVHFADVIMGIFILLMVFIHWAAFRRLAARMRPPGAPTRGRDAAAATDGGAPSGDAEPNPEPGDGDETDTDPSRSDGGDAR
ncbi:hypothetical protein [Natrinema salifodinae]|uniref:Uncharacterized protein n=1 Tax=Natrinema salifodinae TaxID=1202768 RepID=A0A1I0M9K5_9EURY|nr:hypothetical protein [Natrinema salifodinae]SEV85023.1 hypothetical protein SAMN05216285_0675 [Natrinema salifodinae]